MYNFYDDENQNFIKDIEYVRCLYEEQVRKVKQEEYTKDLLFADYVNKVRRHRSRYDLIENIFTSARTQIGNKKKKEREQLSIIESFIIDDFLSGIRNFKITNIMSGGYDSYYWSVEFEGYGQTFYIVIPNMNQINTKNIKYAYDGMFVFMVRDSSVSCTVQKMSYKIEDISEYIKSYFRLDEVNNDEY